MLAGMSLLIVAGLIMAIWVIIELKRFKHKLFAMFLIVLILFTYISFAVTLRDHSVDLKTTSGIMTASKLYFSWLGSIFGNLKLMTLYATKIDWQNKTKS